MISLLRQNSTSSRRPNEKTTTIKTKRQTQLQTRQSHPSEKHPHAPNARRHPTIENAMRKPAKRFPQQGNRRDRIQTIQHCGRIHARALRTMHRMQDRPETKMGTSNNARGQQLQNQLLLDLNLSGQNRLHPRATTKSIPSPGIHLTHKKPLRQIHEAAPKNIPGNQNPLLHVRRVRR